MFVLHVDTLKACAMFAPRSHVVKKPYGTSFLKGEMYLNMHVYYWEVNF